MDAFIALGSNLGDRSAHLRAGLVGLERAGLALRAISSVWETAPVGIADPRWFLNMVVRAEAPPRPLELLDSLLAIERRAGRERTRLDGSRTLDLDLLLLGDLVVDAPRLVLPHPRMSSRRFVLAPLAEIAPGLCLPGGTATVSERLRTLDTPDRVCCLGRLPTSGGSPYNPASATRESAREGTPVHEIQIDRG